MSFIPSDALPDKSAFTEGSTPLTPIGGEYNDSATTPASGQAAVTRITANRALHSNLRDAGGVETATAANPLRVDPTGTTTQPVSVATIPTHAVTQSGTWTVATDADGTTGSAVPAKGLLVQGSDGTNARNLKTDASGILAIQDAGASLTVDNSGTFAVQAAQTGTWTVQPGNTANTTAWKVDGSAVTQPVSLASVPTHAVTLSAVTSGGWSVSSQTALTNTKTTVKSAAGQFGGYMIYNANASVTYIQVFDVALASVTVGTTAPTYVIPLPAGAAANIEFTLGIAHATAIVIAATTTPTGSTAPATALVGFFLNK